MKKIFVLNILVFFAIISSIIITTPIILDIYIYFNSKSVNLKSGRFDLPNYQGKNWPKQHFNEFNSLKTSYHDYIIWRRNDFSGETINIKNGYRVNNSKHEASIKKEIWVFGGSTVWGTGSRDENTIPSVIEKLSKQSVLNLGESGYTSSQELNLLMKESVKYKPKQIIFYSGANDVFHKCRKISNYFSSAKEKEIKLKLENNNENFKNISNLFISPIKVINFLKFKFKKNLDEEQFDCHKNKEKALMIAKVFTNNWKVAKSFANQNGINFIPVLQPVAFTSKSNLSHLPDVTENNVLKKQYNIVYESIKKQLKDEGINYLNLEKSLDEKEYYFIDFCHISENGNLKIAQSIVNSNFFTN